MRLLTVLGFVISTVTYGQESQLGRFSVDFNEGCAPLTVNVTEHDEFGDITRQYFYENANDITSALTHTYTSPGTYHLVQLVGTDEADPKTDTLTVEVLEPVQPEYTLFQCTNRTISLELTDTNYDSFEVSFSGEMASSYPRGAVIEHTFPQSQTPTFEIKGVFENAANNCTPKEVIISELLDEIPTPAILEAVIEQTCQNRFDLTLSSVSVPNVQYNLTGNDQSLYEGHIASTLLLPDITVDMSDDTYCLTLTARNVCDNATTSSGPVCLSVESLVPVSGLFSTYEDENIAIFLDSTSTGTNLFERSFDQINFSQQATGSNSYIDSTPFSGRQYFYRISHQDTCGGIWGEKITSPPFLRILNKNSNTYELRFDSALHHTGETFTYSLSIQGEGQPTAIEEVNEAIDLTLGIDQGNTQTIQVVGISDNYTVRSNILTLTYEFEVFVPKAFTPNGDGLNDRLLVFGLGYTEGQLTIYNRWGQQLYGEISTAPSWNGMIDGRVAEPGIYLYEILVPEMSNRVQKGTFVLLKN